MRTIRLKDLGRARVFAEAACQGEMVAIVGEDGRPVAHIIPATEPITEALVAELEERIPGLAEVARGLIGDPGASFSRARRAIVFDEALTPNSPAND